MVKILYEGLKLVQVATLGVTKAMLVGLRLVES